MFSSDICFCVLPEHTSRNNPFFFISLLTEHNFRHGYTPWSYFSLRTSSEFPHHKCRQPPQEGTAAKHFPLRIVLLLLLLLLCGIPYCKLIKTRQPIVASDKREGNTLHRVRRFLNTYYLFDSFLIAKYFHGQNPPTGEATSPCPPTPQPTLTHFVSLCFYLPEKRRS